MHNSILWATQPPLWLQDLHQIRRVHHVFEPFQYHWHLVRSVFVIPQLTILIAPWWPRGANFKWNLCLSSKATVGYSHSTLTCQASVKQCRFPYRAFMGYMCSLFITLQQTKAAQKLTQELENLEESLALYLLTEDLIAPSSSVRRKSLGHLRKCNQNPRNLSHHTHRLMWDNTACHILVLNRYSSDHS